MTKAIKAQQALPADLESVFGRFMEVQVMQRLLANSDVEQIIHGERRRVTCMFCDICKFTSLAERASPPELFTLLNRYFGDIIDIIFAHEGTIDKMIGDAIMVLFGAPMEQGDQECRAVRCAVAIQHRLAEIRAAGLGGTPLHLAITINTGEVCAGCLGNERRMDYTVLGDAINVAARMQDLAKGDEILLGEETRRSLPPSAECQSLGATSIRGRSDLQEIFELVYPRTPDSATIPE